MKLLITTFFLALPFMVNGQCEVSSAHNIYANASYQWGTTLSYLPDGRDFKENPRIKVSGCDKESARRKLLMIGLGADYFGVAADTVGVAYNGKLLKDSCRLSSSPFDKEQSFQEKSKLYSQRTEFINRCVSLVIRHSGERNLKSIASDECKLEVVDGNTVRMSGGYCFFRIYPDSFFEATAVINQACTDRKVLEWLDIGPQEVKAHANFFVAGDASGLSQDLTPLKSVGLHFNLEAGEELLPMSESYEGMLPRWPNQMALPDIHMGEISLKSVGKKLSLRPVLAVDNRCQARCRAGLCSSPCDYSAPVMGQFSLYRIGANGEVPVLSWFDGGIVPPRWQGILPASFHNLGELRVREGERYRLEFVMNDPKEDFILFAKQAHKKELRLPGLSFDELDLSDGIPEISTDWGIDSIDSIIPIGAITHKNGLYMLQNIDLGLGMIRDFYYWPPYYSEICDSRLLICLPPWGRDYLILNTSFTIGAKDGRKYSISNIDVERVSPLHKAYRKRVVKLPSADCKSL